MKPFRLNSKCANVTVIKRMLHRDTYWRALEEDPDHAGLFTENRGPVKLTNYGFWGTEATREQVRHQGSSTLVLTACHFTGWDHGRKGDACIRAAGGRLIVNGCEFMDDGKQAILLEKGLKAATVFGCCFRGAKGVEDQSGADVQVGLNTGDKGRKG